MVGSMQQSFEYKIVWFDADALKSTIQRVRPGNQLHYRDVVKTVQSVAPNPSGVGRNLFT